MMRYRVEILFKNKSSCVVSGLEEFASIQDLTAAIKREISRDKFVSFSDGSLLNSDEILTIDVKEVR